MLDIQEQEQLDNLKDWWKRHSAKVLLAATVAVAAGAGWQGYQLWHARQLSAASALYDALQAADAKHDVKAVRAVAGKLIDGYGGTPQAWQGALLAARANFEQHDDKSARAQLEWVAGHADEAGLRDLARLRLAMALFDAKDYNGALAQLKTPPTDAFSALYADLEGDVQFAAGHADLARAAWKTALAKLDAKSQDRQLLQMKIDQSE